jgi:hypothetical protein
MLKMKAFVVLSVLVLGTAAAHAAPLSGYFSAVGTDQFTSSTISFDWAMVAGSIGGDFQPYITSGTAINFLSGNLPYTQGSNNIPPFPGGMVPLFTINGSGGEVFTFEMSSYSASYITDGSSGCLNGSTCLNATGTGYFDATGPLTGQSGTAVFTFTSQYAPGSDTAQLTTFSASSSAMAPTPEPQSLALVGSGLLAIAGFTRRRFNI